MTEKDLGQIIPDISATATVDNKVGEPAVNVTVEQINEVNRLERKFNFEFVNMKGEKGDTPIKGVDYLTEEEKQQFTTETLSLVTAEGAKQVKAVTDKASEQTSLVIAEGNKQISLTQTEALKVIEQLKKLVEGNPETSNTQTLSGKTRVEFENDIQLASENTTFRIKSFSKKIKYTKDINENQITANPYNGIIELKINDNIPESSDIGFSVSIGEKHLLANK